MPRLFMAIAHRGASGLRPENTLSAFREALALGAKHLECDVRLSRDGRIVVMHDATVDRTTDGTGRLADLTLAEIRALDAGARFGAAFRGERVPLLEELLGILPADARLVVEIKEDSRFPGLTDAVLDLLMTRKPPCAAVGVSAFEARTLRRVRERSPAIELSALLREQAEPLAELAAIGARVDIVCPKASTITPQLVDGLHAAGYAVRAWGIRGRDEAEMARLIACGVDGMTTDWPHVLAEIYGRGSG